MSRAGCVGLRGGGHVCPAARIPCGLPGLLWASSPLHFIVNHGHHQAATAASRFSVL